jgi:NAD(P)-dependent dehydrogenase (short-subunit alcohol dehydrogenase family)
MGLLEAHAGLAGKAAVVVGGAVGIGRAVTFALAQAGMAVAICDKDEAGLAAIAGEIAELGGRVLSVVADVREADQLDAFFDAVEREFPAIDILVNVAGGVRSGRLLDTSRELDAEHVRLNYGYVIDSFRRAVPLIRATGGGGSIISFTTIEAHRGAATYAVYAGAKAATTNFSRAMAVELAAEGIRVNIIAPDTTPSHNSWSSGEAAYVARYNALAPEVRAKGMKMYIPQKRQPSQQDLANAVLILASDLSSSITGTVLHVDGGTMASSGFIDWPFDEGFGPVPRATTLSRLFGPE